MPDNLLKLSSICFLIVIALAVTPSISAGQPVVTTGKADTMANIAALWGTITPNSSLPCSYYFEYGKDLNYGNTSLTESYTQSPPNQIQALKGIGNLSPSTVYHYRLVFKNSSGTFFGSDMTFKTLPAQPIATTGPAKDITPFSATITGTVNPSGVATSYEFKWDKSGAQYYGHVTPSQSAGSGTGDVPVSYPLNHLTPDTVYTYFLKAANTGGNMYEGKIQSFRTQALPDLAIDYFGINSTSAIKGGNYTLTLKIKNNSSLPSSPTTVAFSGSPEIINIYNLSAPKSVPAVGAGQIQTLNFSPANNSLNVPIGNYTIKAVVNPNGTSFKEVTLSNNENTLVFGVIAQSNLPGNQPPKKIPKVGEGLPVSPKD
jgi:hypothetical protein